MTLLDILLLIVTLSTSLRLFFYSRNGAQFKRSISLLAYLLITVTGALGLMVLLGNIRATDLNPVFILLLAAVSISTWVHRGNVAAMLRSAGGGLWNC